MEPRQFQPNALVGSDTTPVGYGINQHGLRESDGGNDHAAGILGHGRIGGGGHWLRTPRAGGDRRVLIAGRMPEGGMVR